MKSLCTNEIYLTFMEHQCARTCGTHLPSFSLSHLNNRSNSGKCKSDEDEKPDANSEEGGDTKEEEKIVVVGRPEPRTKTKPKEKETCVDVMKNCHRNKKFCHHPSYKEMMKKNCAKTCGYCKPSQKSKAGDVGEEEAEVETPTREARDCKDNQP